MRGMMQDKVGGVVVWWCGGGAVAETWEQTKQITDTTTPLPSPAIIRQDIREKRERDAQVDKHEKTLIRTLTCALSNEPLLLDAPVCVYACVCV